RRARCSEVMSRRRQGLLWLGVVVIAWGLTWPVSKVILASVPPLWTVAFRSAIGTVALFAIGLVAGRLAPPPRGDLPVVIGIALLHMAGFGLLASGGLGLVPTGRAGVPGTALAYWGPAMASRGLPAVAPSLGLLATPVVSVVIATLWLGEPLTVSRLSAIVLILGGVALGATAAPADGEPDRVRQPS